jgi:hypothetical protein
VNIERTGQFTRTAAITFFDINRYLFFFFHFIPAVHHFSGNLPALLSLSARKGIFKVVRVDSV